jgi:hypothetical protein
MGRIGKPLIAALALAAILAFAPVGHGGPSCGATVIACR